MADAASKDKEMKDGVHESPSPQGVEQCAGDIASALSNNPNERCWRQRVKQRLQGDKHTESHADVGQRLGIAMSLEPPEAADSPSDGTQPDKDEQPPAPQTVVTKTD